jgi:hypothetical protein
VGMNAFHFQYPAQAIEEFERLRGLADERAAKAGPYRE